MRMRFLIVIFAVSCTHAALRADPASDPAGLEFFEKRIRPVLSEHCYACHGPQQQLSSLRLDGRASILKGGNRGPALIPGQPDNSLLIKAVRYTDPNFRMPPKGKLSLEQIVDFTQWVRMGAPIPEAAAASGAAPKNEFNLAERRKHWAYQPVRRPNVPTTRDNSWPSTPLDRFILSRLESSGLRPAEVADRRTMIRRVAFDLTGLPPTAQEVDAFVKDSDPNAYLRLVDRLLASPRYGERWGRHWLDLVRYAETLGHEFDFEIFHAWRYRDYVIRAFNADVPYDRFVREHLAGDLLPDPRPNLAEGFNESILGTGFYWLGEGKHSPVDVRQEQLDRIDNQIDVVGKTFLGQTIACARCHDHKFDAISAKDYYALAGYLKSSRYQQAVLDSEALLGAMRALRAQRDRMARELPARIAIADGFLEHVRNRSLEMDDPFYAWQQLARAKDRQEFSRQRASLLAEVASQESRQLQAMRSAVVFEDFQASGYPNWYRAGPAFDEGPSRPGEAIFSANSENPLARLLASGQAHSNRLSTRLEGALRSTSFTIQQPYIHYLAAGARGRINLVVDGFALIRDPIYGRLSLAVNGDPAWRTMNVSMWRGHRAFIEILDSSVPNLTMEDSEGESTSNRWISVDQIIFSEEAAPPPRAPHPLNSRVLADRRINSSDDLAAAYREAVTLALRNWSTGEPSAASEAEVELLDSLARLGLLRADMPDGDLERFQNLSASVPAALCAPAMADGSGEDEHILLRGNHRTPGDLAPRKLMDAVDFATAIAPADSSGRLDLARRMTDPNNPLLARVIVNRLWKHHFGTGIVATPDDFGRMGQAPTHPELLDWLATELIRSEWSLKHMHRLMLLSSTYGMSSRAETASIQADPQNKLWHHMPVRRLEAEAIRDSILSVSGQLNPQMSGPGITPYLNSFMEGRGRPRNPGPLDGDGRRSIYLGVRRNFLNPMFLAYDFPIPFTAIGRRSVSNVPAQALTMMNDPFIIEQARHWAQRLLAIDGERARVQSIYADAFGRPATEDEVQQSLVFVAQQRERVGKASQEVSIWADLCHVMFNVKEFVFLD